MSQLTSEQISTIPRYPRLITGMSRSGTTWLTRVLNLHPDIVAFGETLYWGRGYLPPEINGCYSLSELQDIHRHWMSFEIEPKADKPGGITCDKRGRLRPALESVFEGITLQSRVSPAELFQRLCEAVANTEGKIAWIEKTPHHCMWLDRIFEAMPETRVILMYRDPYDFMLSYKHQGDRKPFAARREFHKLYHPLGCALVWRGYARTIISEIKKARTRQVLPIRFDEFRENEANIVNSILTFLELPKADLAGKLPADNSSFTGQRPHLKSSDIFWMNLVAGNEISELGFARRTTRGGFVTIACSLMQLPLWGTRAFLATRRRVKGGSLHYLRRWILGR